MFHVIYYKQKTRFVNPHSMKKKEKKLNQQTVRPPSLIRQR